MRLKSGLHNHVRKGRKWLLAVGILGLTTVASAAILPNLFSFFDPTGIISTYNANGPIDETSNNPFFQSLGTNGRASELAISPATPLASVSTAFKPSSSIPVGPTLFLRRLTAPIVPITLPTIPPPIACC